ncbi:MAG TPA: DUF4142 domain-containing protein [Gemmatimonadaceae bacterium]|nr:DUF4142 domain-containing protein [Gemmatimonadaceae bacterium]
MQFAAQRGFIMMVAVSAAAAASALGACASSSQYSVNSAGGTVDLAAYSPPPLSTSEIQVLRGMSDEDILGHMVLVDSMEMATADTAMRLIRSDALLSYARLMRANHSTDRAAVLDISQRTGIPIVQQFGGLRASHVAASLDSLRQASDLTIDRHYIMSQVQLHAHVLRELETLQDVARNDAVRQHIAEMIPVVRDHLARAHAIAVERGFEKKRSA